MIEITFLNESKQEKKIIYPDFKEMERAQISCDISTPDYHPITKLVIDGREENYTGNFGDLYFYLLKKYSS